MQIIPECQNKECASKLIISNSARNFAGPALSVRLAINRRLIRCGQEILEIGSGNLRNMVFISHALDRPHLYVHENIRTIHRFEANYAAFQKNGGHILNSFFNRKKYDVVLCTFVLETICPAARRFFYLKSIKASLKNEGIIIASFRGHSGVVGKKYKKCPKAEGVITPLHTFVKPYSIPAIKKLLFLCGIKNIVFLQKYRVEIPKNIHIVAY